MKAAGNKVEKNDFSEQTVTLMQIYKRTSDLNPNAYIYKLIQTQIKKVVKKKKDLGPSHRSDIVVVRFAQYR